MSSDAVIGFSSFSFVFNFSFCLFCSICIKLEIEKKASIGFLLHRLPFITSFSEVPSTPLLHSFFQDPSLFDYWNYNIFSENSWITISLNHYYLSDSMSCLNHPLLLHGNRGMCVCVYVCMCVCVFEYKVIYVCIPYYQIRRQNRFFSS